MKFKTTKINGCYQIEREIHEDERGNFSELFKCDSLISFHPVQCNTSTSAPGVIRGLHGQKIVEQAKWIQCLHGAIEDVAIDIRKDSPTYMNIVRAGLSERNGVGLFIPRGCLHGFRVLGNTDAKIIYLCDNPYSKQNEFGYNWMSPAFGLDKDITGQTLDVGKIIMSDKDKALPIYDDSTSNI